MSMKVVLQEDVKDLGKVGDICNVSAGFARNFLFPRKMAVEATPSKVKEYQHLQKIAGIKKEKMKAVRQQLLDKLSQTELVFKMDASEDSEKLFGSITSADISQKLHEMEMTVDRRDIFIEDPIRTLGEHKVAVKLGEGLQGEIKILVEKKA